MCLDHVYAEENLLNRNTKSKKYFQGISVFHRVFFNSIIDKTPTHALFIQHYISLAC